MSLLGKPCLALVSVAAPLPPSWSQPEGHAQTNPSPPIQSNAYRTAFIIQQHSEHKLTPLLVISDGVVFFPSIPSSRFLL